MKPLCPTCKKELVWERHWPRGRGWYCFKDSFFAIGDFDKEVA